jgi:DNA-directed RNA polymerase subunit RPC12/RpoP
MEHEIMFEEALDTTQLRCLRCGFAAPSDSDDWGTVEHPLLGTVTQCHDCGSTDVHTHE